MLNNKNWLSAIVLLLFITACGSDNDIISEEDEEFPLHYVSDNFRYGGFDYPEDWDVVAISSEVQLTYRDAEHPEEHQYSSTPYRYNFRFGLEADVNEITEEDLQEYNSEQALNEQTNRQQYYHTYYNHYSTLNISKNGFIRLISAYEDSVMWEVHGQDVLIMRQENEWIANWHLNGAYYDLLVKNEANIVQDDQFQQLLEKMIIE